MTATMLTGRSITSTGGPADGDDNGCMVGDGRSWRDEEADKGASASGGDLGQSWLRCLPCERQHDHTNDAEAQNNSEGNHNETNNTDIHGASLGDFASMVKGGAVPQAPLPRLYEPVQMVTGGEGSCWK